MPQRDVVAGNQGQSQFTIEAVFLLVASVGVFVDRPKTEDIFTKRFQHLTKIAHHVVVALAGQFRNLPAAHGEAFA